MRIIILIFSTILFACQGTNKKNRSISNEEIHIKEGDWRFSLQLKNNELPFNVKFHNLQSGNPTATISNGSEQIISKKFDLNGNKFHIYLPVFDSELIGELESENLITGYWIKNANKDLKIPFVAEFGKTYRFSPTQTSKKIATQYHVIFNAGNNKIWDAILILDQQKDHITGTFLTETGDYRFLEGNFINNKLYLSSFNGSDAFLFYATIKNDSLVNGQYISGNSSSAEWIGKADTLFKLKKPQELTYLKENFEYFDFRLPNQNGDTVTWIDLNLKNKVVIIDIMGSWCPNCMDASIALKQLTNNYSEEEIVIIPIAFEATSHIKDAKLKIFKMQDDLGLENKFLFGGLVNKENASEAFPMLNHVMSYPTIVIIGKDREIKQIYTGFYGPGTGNYYTSFMENTSALLSQLVKE